MVKSGLLWSLGELILALFRGITAISLDAKGRFAIPAKYRDDITSQCAGRLVITVDVDNCLLMYPFPEWERIEADLLGLPSIKKQVRRLQRLYLGHASPCELDSQFRLLLPPELRAFAQLEKQVFLVGQGKKFEIWNEQAWLSKREDWINEESGLNDEDSSIDSLSI